MKSTLVTSILLAGLIFVSTPAAVQAQHNRNPGGGGGGSSSGEQLQRRQQFERWQQQPGASRCRAVAAVRHGAAAASHPGRVSRPRHHPARDVRHGSPEPAAAGGRGTGSTSVPSVLAPRNGAPVTGYARAARIGGHATADHLGPDLLGSGRLVLLSVGLRGARPWVRLGSLDVERLLRWHGWLPVGGPLLERRRRRRWRQLRQLGQRQRHVQPDASSPAPAAENPLDANGPTGATAPEGGAAGGRGPCRRLLRRPGR